MSENVDLAAEATLEWFGPPPTAEAGRPLLETIGCGGPDTAEAIARRRRVLAMSLGETPALPEVEE